VIFIHRTSRFDPSSERVSNMLKLLNAAERYLIGSWACLNGMILLLINRSVSEMVMVRLHGLVRSARSTMHCAKSGTGLTASLMSRMNRSMSNRHSATARVIFGHGIQK
jgi:hypothetical protein